MAQFNYFSILFLVFYVGQTIVFLWLERLNLKYIRSHRGGIAHPFEDVIDRSTMARMEAYSASTSHLNSLRDLVSQSVLLILILSGFLTFLDGLAGRWGLGAVPAGLIFFLVPMAILFVIGLPFGWYNSFVIEERFGFNRSTPRLWFTDVVKSTLISGFLLSLLLSILIWTIGISPRGWWLWGFVAVSAIQILLAGLYPVLIAPLFNKFEPVRDELLAKKIRTVMEEGGIRTRKIVQMNAGVRSRHTNAYFTGLGKAKQVVLYDTLIESHTHQEILAVLAHELGHLKKRHIMKSIFLAEACLLVAFYVGYRLFNLPVLYSTFGFNAHHCAAGLFVLGVMWVKTGFFLQPFFMAVSRRFERQADLFSVGLLKSPAPLLAALKRLAADNLSNLRPHPVYVWFHYSHPPLMERAALLETAATGATGGFTTSSTGGRVVN